MLYNFLFTWVKVFVTAILNLDMRVLERIKESKIEEEKGLRNKF